MTERAEHTGEYWLTVDSSGWGGKLNLWKAEPNARTGWPCFYKGQWRYGLPAEIREGIERFRPLANPEKLVRIRLTLTAELIDD